MSSSCPVKLLFFGMLKYLNTAWEADYQFLKTRSNRSCFIDLLNELCSLGGFYQSKIISAKRITHFVPFLPLCRRHVERCAQRELCQRGECQRRDVSVAVGGAMSYTPQDGQLFSSTGCKLVPAKVNLFL